MGMKRDDRGGAAELAGALDDAGDDLLMPDVHPVEIADRGHAPARQIGLAEWIVEDEHRSGGGV
jgi:hypothetical protein